MPSRTAPPRAPEPRCSSWTESCLSLAHRPSLWPREDLDPGADFLCVRCQASMCNLPRAISVASANGSAQVQPSARADAPR